MRNGSDFDRKQTLFIYHSQIPGKGIYINVKFILALSIYTRTQYIFYMMTQNEFRHLFYRGPQGRLAIVANCVFLNEYRINKKSTNVRWSVSFFLCAHCIFVRFPSRF